MTSRSRQRRVLVRSEHPRGAYALRRVRAFAGDFLESLQLSGELSILLTTDDAIHELNRAWRKKDRATDVLSFAPPAGSDLLGDIVISLDTASQQAAERSSPLSDELARLLAHGLLHLLGHDHEQATDARRMAAAEIALLGTAGLVGDSLGVTPAKLEFKRAAPRARALQSSLRAGAA